LQKGGIGSAPKFPQPAIFTLLWRAYKRSGQAEFRNAAEGTLTQMAQGGIYDHLRGGPARYSTGADWLAPHFRRVAYRQSQFIALLTLVCKEPKTPLFEGRKRETIDWVEAEMLTGPDQKTNRAFAASLDADSEGEEGRFYVWSQKQIDEALGDEAAFFSEHYD